jgi:peptidoglycan/LPS O-acetylase OafA/YrhL
VDLTLTPGASIPSTPAATAPKRSHHFPELDALRGLAASVVVLGHFVRLWNPSGLTPRTQLLLGKVLLPFVNGRASVTLFFLLSGFVLTLPYKRRNELPYPTFLLRRLARIYLPYLAALALALLGDHLLHTPVDVAAQVSAWFSETWTAPLTPSLILQHILLIGSYNTAEVNTAFWSLAVEMRLSILFPLLCIPLLRWSRSLALTLFLALLLLDVALPHIFARRLDPVSLSNLTDMTLGLLAFAAGILLARALDPLQALWTRLATTLRLLLFAISFILLEWLGNLGHTPLWPLVNLLTITGGCGILLVALCSRTASLVLNHRLPAWLGRISYSLYLVHATVLFALVHLFFGRLTRLDLLAPYLVCALTLATLFFFIIEKPSIHLSRTIGRRGRTLSNHPPTPTS